MNKNGEKRHFSVQRKCCKYIEHELVAINQAAFHFLCVHMLYTPLCCVRRHTSHGSNGYTVRINNVC